MGLLSSDKNDSKVQKTERVAADAAAAIADEKAKTGKKRAQSYWAVSWNIFKKNKLGMFCLIVVALLCLVAIFAPVLAPYDPDAQEITNMFQNPGGATSSAPTSTAETSSPASSTAAASASPSA